MAGIPSNALLLEYFFGRKGDGQRRAAQPGQTWGIPGTGADRPGPLFGLARWLQILFAARRPARRALHEHASLAQRWDAPFPHEVERGFAIKGRLVMWSANPLVRF